MAGGVGKAQSGAPTGEPPMKIAAAFVALLTLAAAPALAQGKPGMKPEDCARPENAQRSDCARMLGKSGENARTNKGGETRAGDRAGAVKELNAAKNHASDAKAKKSAKEKPGKDKMLESRSSAGGNRR
jgi:hypothetical protein